MIASSRVESAAIGVGIAFLTATGTQAQTPPQLRLHTTLEGEQRPLLCKDSETVGLIVAVLGRAIEARAADADKGKRLFEIAAKLEADICLKPAADDIVILRCNLDQKTFGDSKISVMKLSALLRSNSSAGEQPFYAWTYATIEGSQDGGTSAQEADKRWCTEETAADAPVEPTPDLVQRVQQRLFDFGFVIPTNDGRLTPETVQAVIDFQKSSGLPATGQLTKLTVQKIDATEAPYPWVALAFDGYGNHILVNGLTRRPKLTPSVASGASRAAITAWRRRPIQTVLGSLRRAMGAGGRGTRRRSQAPATPTRRRGTTRWPIAIARRVAELAKFAIPFARRGATNRLRVTIPRTPRSTRLHPGSILGTSRSTRCSLVSVASQSPTRRRRAPSQIRPRRRARSPTTSHPISSGYLQMCRIPEMISEASAN